MRNSGLVLVLLISMVLSLAAPMAVYAQAEDASAPEETVKLIFIHHSTGENWLSDENGGMGLALGENNYFVSDTNYGWGPDGIGDRTDIYNWPEWFVGPDHERYLEALYAENEVHSPYTRDLSDPGGENEVILFKSCFPNSNLEGNPGDPPAPGDGLTVSNARYVYNALLSYFMTRPDKLFVVITAPPVSDPTYAANARAFNNWLVNDWLAENDYPDNNVAIFDFYNLLTGPGNHHRYVDGGIEYINDQGGDTAYYPSGDGDDHPSQEGNLKATAEFVPMLNIFYHRWKAEAPETLPQEDAPASPTEASPEERSIPTGGDFASLPMVIDSFETGQGWEAYWDDTSEETSLSCSPEDTQSYNGENALHLDFDIAPNAWATCALFFDSQQDWSTHSGITFYLHASQPGLIFNFDLYSGSQDDPETYIFTFEAPPDSAEGWAYMILTWDQLLRADWEANAGAPFDSSSLVRGLAYGFSTYEDTPNVGEIWIDDLQLFSGEENRAEEPGEPVEMATEAAAEPEPTNAAVEAGGGTNQGNDRGGSLCPLSIGAPLALVALASRRKRLKILGITLGLAVLFISPACQAASSAGGTAIETLATPTYMPIVVKNQPSKALQPGDFQYLGAFRLPGADTRPQTFMYGGNAMTFNPDGDPTGPDDGYSGSLFITGHDRILVDVPDGSQVAEIDIPVPVLSSSLDGLNRSGFLQNFENVAQGYFVGLDEIPRIGMQYLNIPATGPKIHLAWGSHIQPSPEVPSHAWFDPNLSAPNVQGTWFIGSQSQYSVNGYMFEIPAAWADQYVQGRYLATGRFKDGGWSGMGPAIYAYRPWIDSSGTPAPAGARLEETVLLHYENSEATENIERAMSNYQHPDEWEGGAWVTSASGKSAVLFAGTKSTGSKYWYGFVNPSSPDSPCVAQDFVGQFTVCRLADGTPCPTQDLTECQGHNDYRGWWTTRFDARIILYNPDDLARVASGEINAWEPQPYATLDIDEHLYSNPDGVEQDMLGTGVQRRYRIGDVAYDRIHGLLYILELFADGASPVVHVWRVR